MQQQTGFMALDPGQPGKRASGTFMSHAHLLSILILLSHQYPVIFHLHLPYATIHCITRP